MTVKEQAFNWYYKKFKTYPNLEDPISYNDKIQWLKIYDQDPAQVICCDKVLVKEYVAKIIGNKYIIPNTNEYPAVWKTSHGSGGLQFVNSKEDEAQAYKNLEPILKKTYGKNKGEWAYSFVKPKIIKEKRIENRDVDYKFHCCNGEVKWMQMIWNRFEGKTKECIFDSEGYPTDLHLYSKLAHSKRDLFCTRKNFFELKRIAELLSKKWKYVRVDLYWAQNQPWFGEYTFWPGAGCYPKNKDNVIFGEMLDFDLTTTKPIVID